MTIQLTPENRRKLKFLADFNNNSINKQLDNILEYHFFGLDYAQVFLKEHDIKTTNGKGE